MDSPKIRRIQVIPLIRKLDSEFQGSTYRIVSRNTLYVQVETDSGIVGEAFGGDEDIYQGIRAGAKAYLLKDMRREDLFRCIHEVHAGRTLIPVEIGAKLAERLPAGDLTPREQAVLKLLAQGMPNKLIGSELTISEVTVKSHVQSLFRKLNVLSRTEAIAVATRKGLLRF